MICEEKYLLLLTITFKHISKECSQSLINLFDQLIVDSSTNNSI